MVLGVQLERWRMCHIHNDLFQNGKKVHRGLLVVLLKGMSNIERHLPWHLEKLHLSYMVQKSTPLDGAVAPVTGHIPPNDKFLHSGQRPREPIANLLQRDGIGNRNDKRLCMNGFGMRLRSKSEPGIREIHANQAKVVVCVTDKSTELRNLEGIGRVGEFSVKNLEGWGSQQSHECCRKTRKGFIISPGCKRKYYEIITGT
jgi:hypothetical protein